MIHYCLQEMFSTAAHAVGSNASGMELGREKLGEYESRLRYRLLNDRINDGSRRETMLAPASNDLGLRTANSITSEKLSIIRKRKS